MTRRQPPADAPPRPVRDVDKSDFLIDPDPDWAKDWWGMPGFTQRDARPAQSVTVHFMSAADAAAFSELTGIALTDRTDSAWFPPQDRMGPIEYYYDGPPVGAKYPVCVPSKGRAALQTTGRLLDRLGVAHKFFVEETEYDTYCEHLGPDRVVELPFHDLGRGSIPARNFIWDWCHERGHARHWVVDDNIRKFVRCDWNRRLQVRGGGFFRAMEEFVDRYENVALAGPHEMTFVADRNPNLRPVLWNSRVYSCILIDTTLPYKWRGKYNEDTDLSLRALKDGYCTLLFNALMMNKSGTATGDGTVSGGAMPGGNTDTVYAAGDYRREFAESLKRQHPDVVDVVWKFNRWHHQVDYSPFRRNKPRLRPGVVPNRTVNDFGMELVRRPDAGH